MVIDHISETIAHFIGQFEILDEQARLRQDYAEFRAAGIGDDTLHVTDPQALTGNADYALTDFTPKDSYSPSGVDIRAVSVAANVDFTPPVVHLSWLNGVIYPGYLLASDLVAGSASLRYILPAVEPAGSVCIRISQEGYVSDKDYVSFGGNGLSYTQHVNFDTQLAVLVLEAESLSPLAALAEPRSPHEIALYIEEARATVDRFVATHSSNDQMTAVSDDGLNGTFVNGRFATEGPSALDDYLPGRTTDDASAALDVPLHEHVAAAGGDTVLPSIDLETGGNAFVNEAYLSNLWLQAPVIAAAGNCIQLDVIVQINAYGSQSLMSSMVGGWSYDITPTQTINAATFETVDPMQGQPTPATGSGTFPVDWVVAEVAGDVVFMNWVQQFIFVNDDDIVIASSSGVTSSVMTGGNTTANLVSISELGYSYDLIIVGGSLYSANIVTQINVLLDNDIIGAVPGFETTGASSIASGDNLLWNSASITHIGSAGPPEPMPSAYATAADGFASGNFSTVQDVLQDPALEGLGALRVLYVSGNAYEFQYVEQMTVAGDADQIALAMSNVSADPTTNWTVVTGSNALVNVAAIQDLDSLSKTYVGGAQYSDAVLIQAGLVSSDPELGGQNPDALVSEAVAFLDESMLDQGTLQTDANGKPMAADYAPQADGLHNMLA